MKTKKISATQIEITKEVKTSTVKYERSEVESELESLITSRENFIRDRNIEIAEKQKILDEMDKHGIVAKVEEVVEEIIN